MTKQRASRFSIVPARAVEDRRLSNAAFRVLAALGTFSDKEGWCWPSMVTLAEMLNTSRQAPQRQIRKLCKLGYIEKSRQHRADGGNTSNRYRLLFDRALFQKQTEIEGGQHGVAWGGNTALQGGQPDVAGGATSEVATILKNAPYEPSILDESTAEDKFEEFWRKYPKRKPHGDPKKPAKLKFMAALKRGVNVETIIRGCENYAAYVIREGEAPRFIAQAKTWLDQERWGEDHEPLEPEHAVLGPI